MIKRMLVVLAVAAPMLAQAEVTAGTFEVTGSGQLGYQSTTIEPDGGTKLESSTFGLDLAGLYYVTPMVGVGAEVFYDNTTDKQGGLESKTKSIGLAPKVGLDLHVADQVSLFADAKIGWTQTDSDGFKASGLVWGVGAGLKYFLAPSFSANIGLNYQSAKLQADQGGAKATASNLFFGLGFSGYFGGR